MDAAKTLQSSLAARKGKETLAVFYDPVISWSKIEAKISAPKIADYTNLTEEEKQAFAVSKKKRDVAVVQAASEDLRKQVRDFLAWLKAQGMI